MDIDQLARICSSLLTAQEKAAYVVPPVPPAPDQILVTKEVGHDNPIAVKQVPAGFQVKQWVASWYTAPTTDQDNGGVLLNDINVVVELKAMPPQPARPTLGTKGTP